MRKSLSDMVESHIMVEFGYNVMKGTEYFVASQTSVIREEYKIMTNSDELIRTTECLTL